MPSMDRPSNFYEIPSWTRRISSIRDRNRSRRSSAISLAARREGVQGRSLLPALSGGTLVKRPVHAEFSNIKALRTEDWKLVHYLPAAHGELYHLREDPHELHNLYADAAYSNQRIEMKSLLADWLIDSEDPVLKPTNRLKESRGQQGS